jgi:hypothetical protein
MNVKEAVATFEMAEADALVVVDSMPGAVIERLAKTHGCSSR